MLLNTGNEEVREIGEPMLRLMLDALTSLCHPDGRTALPNDSAFGTYNEFKEF